MTYWLHLLVMKVISIIAAVQSKCSKNPPSTLMHFSTLLATVRVALLRSSWRPCLMRAALFIMRVTSLSLVFTFHPSPQTEIGSVRANFKQLYLHTHWKLDTCLYEFIYSKYSTLPPPKIFTFSPETPCTLSFIKRGISTHSVCLCFVFSLTITCITVLVFTNDMQSAYSERELTFHPVSLAIRVWTDLAETCCLSVWLCPYVFVLFISAYRIFTKIHMAVMPFGDNRAP